MAPSLVFELAFDSVARGLLFGLLGAAITLVFGLGNILNIAIGVFAVVAVIATIELLTLVQSPLLASAGGLAFVGVLGLTVDRTLLEAVYKEEGEDRILLGIFVTIGLLLFIEGILFARFPLSYSVPHSIPTVSLGGAVILGSRIVQVVVSAVVLSALFVFLRYTYLGKGTRTIFQDETGAALCGINIRRIRSLIFVISVVLAGLAGILQSLGGGISADNAFGLTSFGIIVSIVGGVRNVRGTIAAGLLLGFVITIGNFMIGSYLSKMILFATAVVVLLLKPGEIA